VVDSELLQATGKAVKPRMVIAISKLQLSKPTLNFDPIQMRLMFHSTGVVINTGSSRHLYKLDPGPPVFTQLFRAIALPVGSKQMEFTECLQMSGR
jgi:hypothetical protein